MWEPDDNNIYDLGPSPEFPKLNSGNIRTWYSDMRDHLQMIGCWRAADPNAEADEEAELKEDEDPSHKQLLARLHITSSCEPNVIHHVVGLRTGRATLRALLKEYHMKDLATETLAFERFLGLCMDQEEDVMKWYTRIMEAVRDYEWAGGRKLEETELIAKFRQGLNIQYRDYHVIQTIRDCSKAEQDFTLFKYATKLRDSVEMRKAFASLKVSTVQSRAAVPFPPKNIVHKYTVCQICAKIGHIAHDCRSQVSGIATSQQIQRSEKQAAKRRERDR